MLFIDNASSVTNSVTGALAGTGALDSIALFNRNAGSTSTNDAFFNSLQITGP